ncbi:hypothetical protein HDU86_000876 [Geranomyces michiganensis]|nr:hypothetical protein HDU86_000876 [Geranomyces michiganensis]
MEYYYDPSPASCWVIAAVWVALVGAFALKDRADGGRARVLLILYCSLRAMRPFLYAIIPILFREYDATALGIISLLFFRVPASVIFTITTVVLATTFDETGATLSLKSCRRWIKTATSLALAFILSGDFLAIIYVPIGDSLILKFSYGASVIGYSVLLSLATTLRLVLTHGTAESSVAIEEGGLQSTLAPSWRTYLPIYLIVIAKIFGPMFQLILIRGWQDWWYVKLTFVAVAAVMGSLELSGMIGLIVRRVPYHHCNWAERLLFGRAEAGVRLA